MDSNLELMALLQQVNMTSEMIIMKLLNILDQNNIKLTDEIKDMFTQWANQNLQLMNKAGKL